MSDPHQLYYKLVGREVVPCAGALEWAQARQGADRQIGDTWVTPTVRVSTIFLGIDHNYSAHGPPIVFETMVFRDGEGDEQWRYATYHEARRGHWRAVRDTAKALGVEVGEDVE